MKTLIQKLQALEAYIPQGTQYKPEVSAKAVDWHIAHSVLVVDKIYEQVAASNPEDYAWQFNLGRLVVLTRRSVPRGRGKAPKAVLPKGETCSEESLREQLEAVQSKIQGFDKLSSRHYFTHPYFGMLNRKGSLAFMEIHTEHHLKIIRDILR